jgi:hypothetical protein
MGDSAPQDLLDEGRRLGAGPVGLLERYLRCCMRDFVRRRSRFVAGAVLGLVVLVSAAVGAVASGSGTSSSPQTPAQAFAPPASSITSSAMAVAAGPATRLTIVYRPHGGGDPGSVAHRWTLTCDPTGGTLPSRVVACRELAAHGADLIHPGVQCMVIVLHGPTATVTGTWAGHPVRYVSSTCSRAWSTLPAVLTGSSSAA